MVSIQEQVIIEGVHKLQLDKLKLSTTYQDKQKIFCIKDAVI